MAGRLEPHSKPKIPIKSSLKPGYIPGFVFGFLESRNQLDKNTIFSYGGVLLISGKIGVFETKKAVWEGFSIYEIWRKNRYRSSSRL